MFFFLQLSFFDSTNYFFFKQSSFKLRCATVIGIVTVIKHFAFFTDCAKLTMAFTFTSLPLNLYTSVSRCGCGIRVEQKCWWIDRFGQKKGRDQWICIPLFNPLCKQQSSNNIFILIYSTENLPNKLFLCKAGSCPINRFSSD